MKREVIIACDFSSKEDVNAFLAKTGDAKPYLKIGMELFYKEGPEMVRELKERGYKIFLDLKLHDIPNTVYKAMINLGELGVDITNVHAAGGIKMMEYALKGLTEGAEKAGRERAKLIAITQLTSTDERTLKEELLIPVPLKDTVKAYAENAAKAGLDGVVCSAHEAGIIKELGLISVTPGIRLRGDSADDQKRVATPALAKEWGSTYIVVGRSITGAADPLAAYEECVRQFAD
ncbi:MAG: orotidine-5'-phosphate decarboxylase [Firmicutes bacterium]|uniref:Orotidine 5'-phosphate decarboxylase n=1 Tax=Candidatus Stercoripulliclostridium pullicola TaxID=2840953 RepID=A0A940DHE3_9FIRM|nr:orotidine-5'-phosphate decarboxylase [Candidatus Stercoripulliclostridium pullicola]